LSNSIEIESAEEDSVALAGRVESASDRESRFIGKSELITYRRIRFFVIGNPVISYQRKETDILPSLPSFFLQAGIKLS
jgi:hypothetical protein